MRTTSIAVLALMLAIGCSKTPVASNSSSPGVTAQQANLTPEELGELGAKIKQHPADAQKLLSEKGLTDQTFEKAIRKVAESPEESKRYAAAYKKSQA